MLRQLFPALLVLATVLPAAAEETEWDRLSAEGEAALDAEDWAKAETSLKAALKLAEGFGETDERLAATLTNIGDLFFAQDRFKEALTLYERAAKVGEKAYGAEDAGYAAALGDVAGANAALGQTQAAETLYRKAMTIFEKAGANTPEAAGVMSGLATILIEDEDWQQAGPLVKRALAILEKSDDPEALAAVLSQAGELREATGRPEEAVKMYLRALEAIEKAKGPNHPDVADYASDLGAVYVEMGTIDGAVPLFQRAIALREKAPRPDEEALASDLVLLGDAYIQQGKAADAEPLLRKALALLEKLHGPDDPDVAGCLDVLAGALAKQKKNADAEPLYKRAIEILEKAKDADSADLAATMDDYADFLKQAGRAEEAAAMQKKADALHGADPGDGK